jgi:hypothetical protein
MMTLRPSICLILTVALSLTFVDSAMAIRILMHGREPVPGFRDDPFVFSHLEEVFGAENVDYMQGSTAAADGSSATGYDVVFISSTMASGDTRDKYEDSPVGIVCDENALIHDNNVGNFMLSDAGGNQDNTVDVLTKINIVDPSHPLAAGLSGEVTVFKTEGGNWWQFGRSPLGPGVNLIANMVLPPADPPPAPQHAIFAAEKGAQLLGDATPGRPMTAAGRRVFFFMSDFGAFDLTEDGFKLFDAAFQWAAQQPPASVPGDYNSNGTVDAADYVLWRDGVTLQNEVATPGTNTPEDYNEWRARFGNGAVGGTALNDNSAVPEPATCWLTMVVVLVAAGIRRR